MKNITILLSILIILLSACGENVQPPIKATITSTSFHATASPSSTYVPSWLPVFTTTFKPDWTLVAKVQSTDVAFQATEKAKLGDAGRFITICSDKRDFYNFVVSPNNYWIAANCVIDRYFLVINQDGSRKWEIRYEDIVIPQLPDYVQVTTLSPYHWSLDNRYIYFFIILARQC